MRLVGDVLGAGGYDEERWFCFLIKKCRGVVLGGLRYPLLFFAHVQC